MVQRVDPFPSTVAEAGHEHQVPASNLARLQALLNKDYNPDQARDDHGRWTSDGGGGSGTSAPPGTSSNPRLTDQQLANDTNFTVPGGLPGVSGAVYAKLDGEKVMVKPLTSGQAAAEVDAALIAKQTGLAQVPNVAIGNFASSDPVYQQLVDSSRRQAEWGDAGAEGGNTVIVQEWVDGTTGADAGIGSNAVVSQAVDDQLTNMQLFDSVINNGDRHGGNYLLTGESFSPDTQVVCIDHAYSLGEAPWGRRIGVLWANPLTDSQRAGLQSLVDNADPLRSIAADPAHIDYAVARAQGILSRDTAAVAEAAPGVPGWSASGKAWVPVHLAYSPDEPRVPAGSGRESGEWTSGGGGVAVANPEGATSRLVGTAARPYVAMSPRIMTFTDQQTMDQLTPGLQENVAHIDSIMSPSYSEAQAYVQDHALPVEPDLLAAAQPIAADMAAAAQAAEPAITANVVDAIENAGGTRDGAISRNFDVTKSEGSLARKIAIDSEEKQVTPQVAAGSIGDAIRYTATFTPDNYTSGTQDLVQNLKDAGYEPVKATNTWIPDSPYTGYNTQWHDPESGFNFEVQTHTPDSLFLKTAANHAYYEASRLAPDESSFNDALTFKQTALGSTLVMPSGAQSLPSYDYRKGGPAGVVAPQLGPWATGVNYPSFRLDVPPGSESDLNQLTAYIQRRLENAGPEGG